MKQTTIKHHLDGLLALILFGVFAVSILVVLLCVNLICYGPLYATVSGVLNASKAEISDDVVGNSLAVIEETGDEGMVLVKNNGLLPLDSGTKNLNVFGWASTNPVYSGTGSANSGDGSAPAVSILQSLANAGYSMNDELVKMYTGYCSERAAITMQTQDWTLPEPTRDAYTSAVMSGAESFSDTAVIVIGRTGGENADLPSDMNAVINGTYDVAKTDAVEERAKTNYGYTNGLYTNNGDYDDFEPGEHYLELSVTEENMVEKVCAEFDNVVVVINANNAMELGWVDDYPQIGAVILAPGTGNTGMAPLGQILSGAVNPSGRTADTYVKDLTQTPTWNNFGHFGYDNVDDLRRQMVENDGAYQGVISFDVKVTNTGSTAGKEVVEVYFTPPYTNGGIEKASANLVALGKTGIIEPGKSETVKISFQVEDMASFDYQGAGAYVLEAGDYVISINSDSHTVIDSETYNVGSTVTYTDGRASDETPAVSQFGYAQGDVTYLSRKDGFANYDDAVAAPSSYEMSAEAKAGFYNHSNYDPAQFNDSNDAVPTTGAKNGLKLVDLRGKDYDDPQWEQLLDQLTVDDMVQLIGIGGYQSVEISSVGKTQQIDCDGPASINNNFTQKASIGFPAGVVIAATWNTQLAHDFGASIGKMADEMDVSGWYAPAMNIHRTAFSGRNFEYYSEDGYLSGAMASNAVNGAAESGVYSFLKHFALNDQETHRTDMLCTWSNEQAIREIYLKPFEMCVKNYEGKSMAIMSAFNYIGNKYAGANPELLNRVLRDEWGFRGMVLTDYFGGYGYQDADIQIRNGGDFCLSPQMIEVGELTDKTSGTSLQAARQACKNILYTTANSRAYANGAGGGMAAWQIAMYTISAVVILAAVAGEVLLLRGYGKKKG